MRGFVSAWQNTGSGAAGSSSYFGNHYHRLRGAVRLASYTDDGGKLAAHPAFAGAGRTVVRGRLVHHLARHCGANGRLVAT